MTPPTVTEKNLKDAEELARKILNSPGFKRHDPAWMFDTTKGYISLALQARDDEVSNNEGVKYWRNNWEKASAERDQLAADLKIAREQIDEALALYAGASQGKSAMTKLCDKLKKECSDLVDALKDAQHKIKLYREKWGGEYVGGMEYSALMEKISSALAAHDQSGEKAE